MPTRELLSDWPLQEFERDGALRLAEARGRLGRRGGRDDEERDEAVER